MTALRCHGTAKWYGRERDGVGGNRKESDNPYYAGAWFSWLERLPVTQEVAGSNSSNTNVVIFCQNVSGQQYFRIADKD
jgi:hypothetical protein